MKHSATMPIRSRLISAQSFTLRFSEPSRVLALLALGCALLMPERAVAQFEPAGSITLNGLIAGDDYGGGATLDLGVPIGDMLRIGGVVGALAIVSDNDDASRVFLPLGISAALTINTGAFTADLRVRAGMWGGATNEGLTAGGFVGGGAFIGYALSEDVGVVVGVEAWYTLGGEAERLLFLPGLGFVWRPSSSDELPAESEGDVQELGTEELGPPELGPPELGPPELGPPEFGDEAPATEVPAAPAPGTEPPALPATEVPAAPAPGTEVPAAPGTEVPAAPGTEVPAAPGTEAATAPAAPATEDPAAEPPSDTATEETGP